MTQEHVLAEEEQMTAARTKQHLDEKHTGIPAKYKKIRKQGKERDNRTQGVNSIKASRLCYEAEPGTLSPALPSSSYSRRQRYQVPALPLSRPTSENKSTKTTQNFQDSGVTATQVPLSSRTGTLPHDLHFISVFVDRSISTAAPPFPPPPFP